MNLKCKNRFDKAIITNGGFSYNQNITVITGRTYAEKSKKKKLVNERYFYLNKNLKIHKHTKPIPWINEIFFPIPNNLSNFMNNMTKTKKYTDNQKKFSTII